VHRPLLHRLWVGIAKVKIAGKEEFGHGLTIAPLFKAWQAIFFRQTSLPTKLYTSPAIFTFSHL
jgi:hypothetical protein